MTTDSIPPSQDTLTGTQLGSRNDGLGGGDGRHGGEARALAEFEEDPAERILIQKKKVRVHQWTETTTKNASSSHVEQKPLPHTRRRKVTKATTTSTTVSTVLVIESESSSD